MEMVRKMLLQQSLLVDEDNILNDEAKFLGTIDMS